MKKFIHSILLGLGLLLLSGCAGKAPSESTLEVSKKGGLTYTIVEDFDKDFYDAEELRSEIEKEVADYNGNFDTAHLVLKAFEVEEGTASLQLKFDAYKYFEDYSGMKLFVGTVGDAKAEGYDVGGELMGADGALTDAQTLGGDKLHVVILEPDQELCVQLPKPVLGVSLDSGILDKKTVKAEEAKTTVVVYK